MQPGTVVEVVGADVDSVVVERADGDVVVVVVGAAVLGDEHAVRAAADRRTIGKRPGEPMTDASDGSRAEVLGADGVEELAELAHQFFGRGRLLVLLVAR